MPSITFLTQLDQTRDETVHGSHDACHMYDYTLRIQTKTHRRGTVPVAVLM